MNLLSLDVSMRNVGACIFIDNKPTTLFYLDNSKVKCQTKFKTVSHCFYLAINFIKEITQLYNLDYIVQESPTGSQSFNSALNYSFESCFNGCMSFLCKDVYIISPIKGKLVTGNKNAQKSDVIKWCVSNYPNLNYPSKNGRILAKAEHCCDALVNGLAFIDAYFIIKPEK